MTGLSPGALLVALAMSWSPGPVSAAAPSGGVLDSGEALARSQAAIGRKVGDYPLLDAEGREVRLSRYRGKPLLVSFVYTSCSQVCPATTKFLYRAVLEAQEAVGGDAFNVVTIGFNLPFDTHHAMAAFARRQGIDLANWHFLSPEPAAASALTADFGFVYAATQGGFDHLTQVTIVDADGKIHSQVYGDTFELPMLVAPLKELVLGTPAPTQDLAALLEKVRLLCTVYDPASGRYRLDYGLFIEIFAGLTIVGGTLYYLLLEWRRHRRSERV